MAKSWESLGSKVIERWFSDAFAPAFVFWTAGAALVVYSRRVWDEFARWATAQDEARLVILGVLALLVVSTSAAVVERSSDRAIRWLEGYWPRAIRPVERLLLWRVERHFRRASTRLDALDRIDHRTPAQEREHAALDEELSWIPADAADRMPTRLGNILRAAETRPFVKYGLDAVICWPRLWLLLPDLVRKELGNARSRLEGIAQTWIFSLLFLAWTPLSWWAVPIAAAVMLFTYRQMLSEARLLGDLLDSAFDLHRTALYKALGWELPRNPADERARGVSLTEYLDRGTTSREPEFTWAEAETPAALAPSGLGELVDVVLDFALRALRRGKSHGRDR